MSGTSTPPPLTAQQQSACTALMAADAAYLALVQGGGIRAVTDQNGERIEYTMANSDNLLGLIRNLQTLCPAYQALALGRESFCRARPMRFLF
jgi:hypothetical protein